MAGYCANHMYRVDNMQLLSVTPGALYANNHTLQGWNSKYVVR
jgi:hypothetical protein